MVGLTSRVIFSILVAVFFLEPWLRLKSSIPLPRNIQIYLTNHCQSLRLTNMAEAIMNRSGEDSIGVWYVFLLNWLRTNWKSNIYPPWNWQFASEKRPSQKKTSIPTIHLRGRTCYFEGSHWNHLKSKGGIGYWHWISTPRGRSPIPSVPHAAPPTYRLVPFLSMDACRVTT